MFDPMKFSMPEEIKTITFGNSEHPAMKYVVGDRLKKVPSKSPRYEGLYYIALKSDKGVVTYRPLDYTFQAHLVSFEEFKDLVKNDKPLPQSGEVTSHDCEPFEYIGNTLLEVILYDIENIGY